MLMTLRISCRVQLWDVDSTDRHIQATSFRICGVIGKDYLQPGVCGYPTHYLGISLPGITPTPLGSFSKYGQIQVISSRLSIFHCHLHWMLTGKTRMCHATDHLWSMALQLLRMTDNCLVARSRGMEAENLQCRGFISHLRHCTVYYWENDWLCNRIHCFSCGIRCPVTSVHFRTHCTF